MLMQLIAIGKGMRNGKLGVDGGMPASWRVSGMIVAVWLVLLSILGAILIGFLMLLWLAEPSVGHEQVSLGWIGAAISAVGNTVNSYFDRQAASDLNAKNLAWQREQYENFIKTRVKDAKEAGIHPLYALGAGATSFAGSSALPTGSAIGDGLQGFGNAVTAYEEEKYRAAKDSRNPEQGESRDEALSRARINRANADTAEANATIAKARARTILDNARNAPLYDWEGYMGTPAGPPQQKMEDEFGGVIGELYGIGRYLDMHYDQTWKPWVKEKWKNLQKRVESRKREVEKSTYGPRSRRRSLGYPFSR